MKKTFMEAYYLSHRGCYEKEKMQKLINENPYETLDDFLNWPISIKDKCYFIRQYTELTRNQLQWFALCCAKVSLKIYEEKYPNDKRIANCIQATEDYLKGKISIDILNENRNAADVAAYAAYAAYAVAAYADAADAVNAVYADVVADVAAAEVDAAEVDAYTVCIAADNAAAYVAAYDAAKTHKTNLLDSIKQFCKEQS